MSSADQIYDRSKYDITDCIARPILRDQYNIPTPLINLIADYAIQLRRRRSFAKIECPIDYIELKANLDQLSVEENRKVLYLGLPANQNNIL